MMAKSLHSANCKYYNADRMNQSKCLLGRNQVMQAIQPSWIGLTEEPFSYPGNNFVVITTSTHARAHNNFTIHSQIVGGERGGGIPPRDISTIDCLQRQIRALMVLASQYHQWSQALHSHSAYSFSTSAPSWRNPGTARRNAGEYTCSHRLVYSLRPARWRLNFH